MPMKALWIPVMLAFSFGAVASVCESEGAVEVVYNRYANEGPASQSIVFSENESCASVNIFNNHFVVERCGDQCYSGRSLKIHVFEGARALPTFDFSDPNIDLLGHRIKVYWYMGQYAGDQRVWLAYNEVKGVVGIAIGDIASPLFVLSGRCGLWAKYDCYEHGSDERLRLLSRDKEGLRKSLLEVEEKIRYVEAMLEQQK